MWPIVPINSTSRKASCRKVKLATRSGQADLYHATAQPHRKDGAGRRAAASAAIEDHIGTPVALLPQHLHQILDCIDGLICPQFETAFSRRKGTVSTATTDRAPAARATCNTAKPIVPHPRTTTFSPLTSRPRLRLEWQRKKVQPELPIPQGCHRKPERPCTRARSCAPPSPQGTTCQ